MPEIGEPFIPQKLFTELGRFVGPIVPVSLMQYEGLSIYAKHCWDILACRAGQNGECFSGYKDLAKGTMSIRQAKKAIKELEVKGFINKTSGGRGKSNRYQLLWHEFFAQIFEPALKVIPKSKVTLCPEALAETARKEKAVAYLRSQGREIKDAEDYLWSLYNQWTNEDLDRLGDWAENGFKDDVEQETTVTPPPGPCDGKAHRERVNLLKKALEYLNPDLIPYIMEKNNVKSLYDLNPEEVEYQFGELHHYC